MASIRKLKKDINYLTYELLTEVFAYRHFHPDMKDQRFEDILGRIISIRNDLITRANHPEAADETLVHEHFSKVRQDMVKLVDVMEDLSTD